MAGDAKYYAVTAAMLVNNMPIHAIAPPCHVAAPGPCRTTAAELGRLLRISAEMGAKSIRANAISPGPISAREASGIDRFDASRATATAEAPTQLLDGIDEVGALAAFPVSDAARRISGNVAAVNDGPSVTA